MTTTTTKDGTRILGSPTRADQWIILEACHVDRPSNTDDPARAAIAAPNPSTDPKIDPQLRAFLTDLNKDRSPFWELPQPK